ncbi:hypothetical protein BJV82DRAFT_603807 [Fennellomyces sp. T-0311]|nr:hypothetical protein BJV82DRAFT_603807 [Fennellomyces sp. T-0311]
MTTDKSLAGKVAVITGGSRNIGKAVAVALVNRGAKVVIGDILDADGAATIKELNELAGAEVAAYIRTDVTKYADNSAMFQLAEKKFGGVDIAFLNAGIGNNANTMFLPLDDALDERMIDINTTSVIKGTKVAMLHMAKRGGGVIVNMASAAGLRGTAAEAIYCASKHGVVGWVRSCDIYKAVCNVRVNAICPTFVETSLAADLSNSVDQDPFAEVVKAFPKVKMETVVEGVLKLIQDEDRNAQTLMALPHDLIKVYAPEAPYIPSEPEYKAAVEKYSKDSIVYFRKRLAEAQARYGI